MFAGYVIGSHLSTTTGRLNLANFEKNRRFKPFGRFLYKLATVVLLLLRLNLTLKLFLLQQILITFTFPSNRFPQTTGPKRLSAGRPLVLAVADT